MLICLNLEELMEIDFFKSIYLKYKNKINKTNYKIATYQIVRDSIDLMIRDLLANTRQNLKDQKIKSVKDIAVSKQTNSQFFKKNTIFRA